MKLQYIILALWCIAAAALVYNARQSAPAHLSDAEAACLHAIATGNILRAKGCI